MQQTFNALAVKYIEHQKNVIVPGRKTYYEVPNKLTQGMHLAQTAMWKVDVSVHDESDNGDWQDIPLDDIEEEVEEQGDLEVDD